jgi:hypothetical protein
MLLLAILGGGVAVLVLFLYIVLKKKIHREPVWETLADTEMGLAPTPRVSSNGHSSEILEAPNVDRSESILGRETPMPIPDDNVRSFPAVDGRRSTRIERPVPLIVLGTNKFGQTFQERTNAVSLNLHGCRYPSRHEYPLQSMVTLQVTGTDGGAPSRALRARVRSVQSPSTPRDLFQVGVELETPGNVWGVPTPPEDWQHIPSAIAPSMNAATAVAPAREPSTAPPPPRLQAVPDLRRSEVGVFPSPSPAADVSEPAPEAAAAKPERVVISQDQLLSALQGKMQQAAEKAVQSAVATHLDEAIRTSLLKMDEAWKANVRQIEDSSAKRLEVLISSSQGDALRRLDERLEEVQSNWQEQQVAYRKQAEEIALRLQTIVGETQKFVERVAQELEPQIQARLDDSFGRAARDFEAGAALVSDQQLSRLTENTQRQTQEAAAQLQAGADAKFSLLQSSIGGQLEQRLDALVGSSKEELLARLEAQLGEVRGRFETQQDAYRHRAEEIARELDQLAANARQEWGDTQKIVERVAHEIEPQLYPKLEQFVHRAAEQFESSAARFSDQQLARLAEGTQRVSQEAVAYLQAGADEKFSLLQNSIGGILDQRLDTLVNSSKEELLARLQSRLGEVCNQWEAQQSAYRHRADEIAQQLDQMVANTRQEWGDTQKIVERVVHDLEPQLRSKLEEFVHRAAEDFQAAAARASDRQLVRLMEEKQMVTREASSQLEAHAAETRSLLQSAANGTLEEFRRQLEVQVELALSETTQRVTSSLASLDAENRAALAARRQTLEGEVARVAAQSTQEFRTGIKAFLYSCLVAAVSAVDEHAQSTLGNLAKDPLQAIPELGQAVDPSNSNDKVS